MRSTLATLLYAFILVWVFAVGPMCWILRDGLGPDAVETTGWNAVERFFLTFFWGPVLICLGVAWAGVHTGVSPPSRHPSAT